MSKLITHSTFDSNNIFIYSGKINNNFLKLDIARINEFNQIPLMLFIDEINVIDFNKNNILLDLRNQPDTRNMFTKLDEYIISYIQHMKIIKQYEFKNFTYKPFISSYTTLSNEVFDVLNLNISLEGTYHTMLFYSYNNPLKNLSVMKKNVKVVQLNTRKKEVQIQHGALSVWVTSDTLRWPSGAKPSTPIVRINIERSVKGDIEIDCRGMRLDEFQKTCEQAIDEVFAGEVPFVTIIHGHGDGILKNWLRNTLRKDHKDLRWENIEGNDGCTKISL